MYKTPIIFPLPLVLEPFFRNEQGEDTAEVLGLIFLFLCNTNFKYGAHCKMKRNKNCQMQNG